MGLLGKIWNAVTGSGGDTKSSSSFSNQMQQDTAQTTNQSQIQQMLQQIFNQQLVSALQNLSGTGTQAQKTEWGLAPQDPFATMGQQGMAGLLQSGYQPGQAMQNLGTTSGSLTNMLPQFQQMLTNPSQSASAQDQIAGMTRAAQDLFTNTMKPIADANYTRSGMFGSVPWASELSRGSQSLAANLGGQAAGILGNTSNQGLTGMLAAPGAASQMAGTQEQYNPFTQMLAGWNALSKTGAPAVQTGQTGAQQFQQTGTSQQAGTGTQSTLANALASMMGTGTQNISGTSSGQGMNTVSQPGSLVGGLQNITNLLGGSGGSQGTQGLLSLLPR